jgi:SNF2 family DNA or RNA helicase
MVSAFRSNLDGSERKKLINNFNNENTNINTLLLNLKSLNSGLNLHYHCSNIIIICCADNIN